MIIDEILDRKDGVEYDAHKFYIYCLEESAVFKGIGDKITIALDYGKEEDVKKALCEYIDEQKYDPEIKNYINSVNWLED